MNIELLKGKCDELIRDYAKSFDVLYDLDCTKTKDNVIWTLNLQTIKIEFVYTIKNKLTVPVSTLFCTIFLDKNDLPYHLTQIIDYLGIDDYHSYIFSCIENEKRLTDCFNELTGFLDKNLPAITNLVTSGFDFSGKRKAETTRVLKLRSEEELEFGLICTFDNQIARYTDFPAYKFFLKGNYPRSLKQYYKLQKKNTLYDYESKLVSFMERLLKSGETFEAVRPECASLLEAQKYNGSSKRDALSLLLSMVIAYFALLIPISIIVFVVFTYLYHGTLFEFDPLEQLYLFFLTPAIPAICGGIAIVDKVSIWLSKDKKSARDFSEILLPPKTKKAVRILTLLAFSFAVCFSFFIELSGVKCYEEYMLCNVSESDFKFEFERYNYNDVEEIYKVDGVYNEYTDETMDVEAYVIRFKNGDVNTYDYLELQQVEDTLLPQICKYYRGEVRHVKSDLDI